MSSLFAGHLYAQDEMTMLTLSGGHNALGSSRYQALSGAMGAIGVDFSSINQNPAGIALFRSGSKISLTGSGIWGVNQGSWYGQEGVRSKNNKFSLTEFSYLASLGTPSQGVTLGISVSNGGRFDRSLSSSAMKDSRLGTSLADYSAALLNRADIAHNAFASGEDLYANGSIPWLGILGMKAGWIEPVQGVPNGYQTAFAYSDSPSGELKNYAPSSMSFVSEERGGITNIDFSLGFRLSPKVNLGLLMRGQSLNYEIYTSYKEGFQPNDQAPLDYLLLDNERSFSALGVGFGFGVLAEVMSGLRLGASVYTPTFYNMKQDFVATATGYNNLFRLDPNKGQSVEYRADTPREAANAFSLSTPWRFGISSAYVFGRRAIVSADYEFVYSASARLFADDYDGVGRNPFESDNSALRSHFMGMHRIRLGAEINLAPRIALRAGYRYESAVDQSKLFATPGFSERMGGTLVHYRLGRGLSAVSAGVGFRLSPVWTLDLAYTGESRKAVYRPIPSIEDPQLPASDSFVAGLESISERQMRHTASATLSLRF